MFKGRGNFRRIIEMKLSEIATELNFKRYVCRHGKYRHGKAQSISLAKRRGHVQIAIDDKVWESA